MTSTMTPWLESIAQCPCCEETPCARECTFQADAPDQHEAMIGARDALHILSLATTIADDAAAADIETMCACVGEVDGEPVYDPTQPAQRGDWEEATIDRALRYLAARGRIVFHGALAQVHGPWSQESATIIAKEN